MEENKQQTVDSRYIQQHLANERTYLAWIRTCITIIGVGFLITNLHFSSLSAKIGLSDLLAQIGGLASIIVGIVTLISTTVSYFKKSIDINRQSFVFSKFLILTLSFSLLLIVLAFGFYYLFVWGLIPA
ncbi:YidH family protein [Neobacillus sp. SM06]|uniref:YidH family protein n=1 Tax=Neobacillus sp. SM06 TaxID=3422492 RepID=UPI003D29F60B